MVNVSGDNFGCGNWIQMTLICRPQVHRRMRALVFPH